MPTRTADVIFELDGKQSFEWLDASFVPREGDIVAGKTGVQYRVKQVVWYDPRRVLATIERVS